MTDLSIGSDTFRVEVEGDPTRPTLMLSHALGVDLTMWDGQMPALTKHFRVVRYDSRGHGGSVAGGSEIGHQPASIAQLGRDALAILDALEVGKTHWAGVSMGGAVGLWLLAHAPDRIDRAVLANTAPRLGNPESWNARIVAVLTDGMETTAEATIERWFSTGFAAREPARVAAIRDLLRETPPEGYAACCAALRDMDLRETLHGIAHEVLIVTGDDDPVVPEDDVAAFIEAIPGARHVALDARHLSNIEAEADFNTGMIHFLTAKARIRAKPVVAKSTPRKTRKPVTTKAAPAKRGGATRRASAARSPLKKSTPKRTATKTASAPAAKKKPGVTRRRPAAKAIATSRPAPKAIAKTPPTKAAPRKPAPKADTKAAPARRLTAKTARGPVKAAVKKAKPGKPPAKTPAKAPAKKTAPNRGVAKKLPAARRKPATKPRRPTGRRKP